MRQFEMHPISDLVALDMGHNPRKVIVPQQGAAFAALMKRDQPIDTIVVINFSPFATKRFTLLQYARYDRPLFPQKVLFNRYAAGDLR